MPGLNDVRLPDGDQHTRSEQIIGPQIVLRAFERVLATCRPLTLIGCIGAAFVGFGLGSSVRADDVPAAASPAPQPGQAPAPAAGPVPGAPSASAPVAAKPSPPLAAGIPTPEHVAKARRLILATGISRSFQIIIPEFMEQIGNTLTQSRPDLVHDMNLVLVELKPEFDRQSDEMIDQSARIYATLLSESEIDAILAFFDSDAGKRYVGAQPFFLNQLVSGMQAWQQKISINMMARAREEMKKKGHNL